MTELGTLERVAVCDVWATEAAFTSWLANAEHLPLLGGAIGMELELEAVEQPVGDFFADILWCCRPTAPSASLRAAGS
jgi:hypothetical protein